MDYVLFLAGVNSGVNSNVYGFNYPVNCTSDNDCMLLKANGAVLEELFAWAIDYGRDRLSEGCNLRFYCLDEDESIVQSALSILGNPSNVIVTKVSDKGPKYLKQGAKCKHLAEIQHDVLNNLRAEVVESQLC